MNDEEFAKLRSQVKGLRWAFLAYVTVEFFQKVLDKILKTL